MNQHPLLFSRRMALFSYILKLLHDVNNYCILYIRKIEVNIVALLPMTPKNKRCQMSIRSCRIKDETSSFAEEYTKESMQIKSNSNNFLAIILLAALCCSFLFLTPKIAQAGWEQVMNAASNLSEGAQKKRAEINKRVAMDDKKVKEYLDKAFEDQFKKVFEGDLKPSQVYDVLQFVEAASAGDLDSAMKTGGEFMVGLIPGVGQYISAMKTLAKGIRMAEQVWINELYQTSAYNNLFSIVNPALRENFYSDSFRPPEPFSRSYGGAPYIPSFLIRYSPNAPEAAIMGRLQAHMQHWEDSMYQQWRAVDGGWPVTQLQQPPWAAKLRSAYGKVLSDREIFNRFLYRIVEPERNKIVENLRWIYLRPAAMKAALQEKQKINAAVEQALAKISFDDGKELWAKTVNEIFEDTIPPPLSSKYQGTREKMLASKSMPQKIIRMTPSELAQYKKDNKIKMAEVIYNAIMNRPSLSSLDETHVQHLFAKGLVSKAQFDAYAKKIEENQKEKELTEKIYTRLIALRDRMDPDINRLAGEIKELRHEVKRRKDENASSKAEIDRIRPQINSKADRSDFNRRVRSHNIKVTETRKLADKGRDIVAKRKSMIDLMKSINSAWKAGNHRQVLDIANNSPVAREYGWQTFNP
jgi:hypothetical protein